VNLREKRCLLTRLTARLIDKAISLGYEPALDQVKRTQAEADANAAAGKGIKNSLHLLGLAVDLLLYRAGVYVTDTATYTELGEWWEQQHSLCRWGGRFKDGNHFSIEHEGRK
jgi:hypothetical protein